MKYVLGKDTEAQVICRMLDFTMRREDGTKERFNDTPRAYPWQS